MSKHVLVGCLHSESRRLPAQSMRLTVTLPFFQDTMVLWGLMSRWLLPSLCTSRKICKYEHNMSIGNKYACSGHHTTRLNGLLTSSSNMPAHSRESDYNELRCKLCQWLQVAASVSKHNLLHMWVNRGGILDHRLGINCLLLHAPCDWHSSPHSTCCLAKNIMEVQTCARACARCMEKCHTQACKANSRSLLRLSLHAFFCTDRMMVYRSQPSTSLHHSPASDLTHRHGQCTAGEDAKAPSGSGAVCLPNRHMLTHQHLHVKCTDCSQSQNWLCLVNTHPVIKLAQGRTTPLSSSTCSVVKDP